MVSILIKFGRSINHSIKHLPNMGAAESVEVGIMSKPPYLVLKKCPQSNVLGFFGRGQICLKGFKSICFHLINKEVI